MPTPLEQVLAAVQPVGGSAWIDEILIRGQPGGGIRGAHVVIGWEAPGIMGGMERGLSGPWPLSASADDEEFAALANLLSADMADQLTALQGTLAASVAELTTATNRIAELETQLAI